MKKELPTVEQASDAGISAPGRDARNQQYQAAITELRGFADLPKDWDTYGGSPADMKVIDFAVRLLEVLRDGEIDAPSVHPIGEGAYLVWKHEDAALHFGIDKESVLCFVTGAEGVRHIDEDSTFDVDRAKDAAIRFFQRPL